MIKAIKAIFKSVREFKWPTFLTFIFIIGEVILESLIPYRTANLINSIKYGVDMSIVTENGLILIVMALSSLICGGLAGFTCAKATAGFIKNLRHDLFVKIQSFSFENIDKYSSSSLITRLTTDCGNIYFSYMMAIRIALRSPLMFIFAIIMSYKMGGALSTTFVVVIPILIVGFILILRKAFPAFERVFKKYDKMNESVEENVRAMRTVKGFAREEYEKKKFYNVSQDIKKDFEWAESVVALNTPLMQFCMNFNMIFVLLVGSRMTITSMGQILDIGQISAMLTYGVMILMSLMMIASIFIVLTISRESIRRVGEVINEESTLTDNDHPIYEIKDGSVDFDNVGFKYKRDAEKYTLENINVHIKSGMTVGILGGTGVGKTSLVQLIPRLYDVTTGSVRVGGIDVRDYDVTALREAVSMVLQKNELFSGTIKDNLRWGNPDATDEQIIEACKLAQVDEFVKTFPDGYDTYIEQGGTNVSGGQKQRLCIARALLKSPKILILDDSTSAVDTRTDALIRKGFKSYIPETTKIIIAQRVASVEDADLILIMENGLIAAQGTHEELLKSNKEYRETYEQQTRGGQVNE